MEQISYQNWLPRGIEEKRLIIFTRVKFAVNDAVGIIATSSTQLRSIDAICPISPFRLRRTPYEGDQQVQPTRGGGGEVDAGPLAFFTRDKKHGRNVVGSALSDKESLVGVD